MKIGFPVLDKVNLNEMNFDNSLHSSKYFAVFCDKTQDLKILDTESVLNQDGGLGVVPFLKSENVNSIISPECFTMAAKFFKDNGITVYQANGNKVLENLELLAAGTLPKFTNESAKKANKCGDSCADCDSSCDSTYDTVDQEVVMI